MRVVDGSRVDYGFDLGGFILKDRLWIFGAFNRVELRGDLSRVESSRFVSTEDRFPFDAEEYLYSGKLTWNAAPSTTVVGTVFADPSATAGAAGADPRQGIADVVVDPIVNPDPSTWFSTRQQGGRISEPASRSSSERPQSRPLRLVPRRQNALTAPDGVRSYDWRCEGGTPASPCDPPDEPINITGGYGFIAGYPDRSHSRRQQYQGDVTF